MFNNENATENRLDTRIWIKLGNVMVHFSFKFNLFVGLLSI